METRNFLVICHKQEWNLLQDTVKAVKVCLVDSFHQDGIKIKIETTIGQVSLYTCKINILTIWLRLKPLENDSCR